MRILPESIINALSFVAISFGVAGLLGWVLNIPFLYMLLSNGATIKFITALSTVLTGAALLSLNNNKKIVTQLLSGCVLLIGILTVLEYVFNINLGIDIAVTHGNTAGASAEQPGRMSLYSACLFVVVSAAILLFTLTKYFVGQSIVLFGILISYSALLGVFFNIGQLFTFGRFSAVSFPTAISLLATCIGLSIYTRDEGWLPDVFGSHSAAMIARNAILYFFLATPVFVGLFLISIKYTLLPPEFILVTLIILSVASTLPFAFRLLRKISRADKESRILTKKLRKRSLQLVNRNQELGRINKDLDNIIHIVSHDLKTPITSLQLSLEILDMKLNGTTDQHLLTLLTLPKRSVSQLKELIDHLGITIRSQVIGNAQFEDIDICELIEELKATNLQAAISDTGTQITTHIDDCTFVYERIHISSILQNLISNGIKYHMPGRQPVINVSIQKAPGGVQLQVEDNGLGIPEKEMPNVFTKYKRFHQHIEGSGVGLYLTKRLIGARGGSIEVSSKEGIGTVFNIFFPDEKRTRALRKSTIQ